MQLRAYPNAVRSVLLLITFQFFSSAITPESGVDIVNPQQSIHVQHSKSLSLSMIYEESKKEKEREGDDEKFFLTVELVDLSFISQILTQIHTEVSIPQPIENQYTLQPPLFTLHRVFVI